MLLDIKVVNDPKPPPGRVVLDYRGRTFEFGKNQRGELICISDKRYSQISTAEDLSLKKKDWAALFKKAGKEFSKRKKITKSILERKTINLDQKNFLRDELASKMKFPEDQV